VAVDVTRLFDDAGIPSIVLKGPTIAHELYDDPAERAFSDVDVLVPPRMFKRACDVLSSARFTDTDAGRNVLRARTFAHPTIDAPIDLHFTILGATAKPDRVWSVLARDTRRLSLDRGSVTALSQAGIIWHVALHASQHGTDHPFVLRDLQSALDRCTLAAWQRAWDIATATASGRSFRSGLSCSRSGVARLTELGLASTSGERSVQVAYARLALRAHFRTAPGRPPATPAPGTADTPAPVQSRFCPRLAAALDQLRRAASFALTVLHLR
jgi:hypothetical protein